LISADFCTILQVDKVSQSLTKTQAGISHDPEIPLLTGLPLADNPSNMVVHFAGSSGQSADTSDVTYSESFANLGQIFCWNEHSGADHNGI
jgi:hypothetical protein